jgi:hypothetical protein
MPRESLDAPEDLPKEAPRQLAFGKLEREVPRVPNQAPAECEEGLAIRPSQPVGSSPLDLSTRGRRVETILVVRLHPERQLSALHYRKRRSSSCRPICCPR